MKKSRILLIIGTIILLSSCTSSVRFTSGGSSGSAVSAGQRSTQSDDGFSSGDVITGKASYYASKFNGRQTASGDIYDESQLTAAHKELNFGTKVKVRNLKNGLEVVVVINDRGPFAPGRVIDLSYSAAEAIDMLKDGVVDVEITVLE